MHNSKNTFSERLQRLAKEKNIFQADLVVALKKHSSTISKWWNGEIVPGPKNIRLIAHFFDCNEEWLATGKGEPFPLPFTSYSPTQRVTELIAEEAMSQNDHEPEEQDHLSISEMLVMTTVILESNTVYRSALASNVRAFYEAVKREEEMRSVDERLEEMQGENRMMSERMARMEEMLLSMGASVPQKRDQKTG